MKSDLVEEKDKIRYVQMALAGLAMRQDADGANTKRILQQFKVENKETLANMMSEIRNTVRDVLDLIPKITEKTAKLTMETMMLNHAKMIRSQAEKVHNAFVRDDNIQQARKKLEAAKMKDSGVTLEQLQHLQMTHDRLVASKMEEVEESVRMLRIASDLTRGIQLVAIMAKASPAAVKGLGVVSSATALIGSTMSVAMASGPLAPYVAGAHFIVGVLDIVSKLVIQGDKDPFKDFFESYMQSLSRQLKELHQFSAANFASIRITLARMERVMLTIVVDVNQVQHTANKILDLVTTAELSSLQTRIGNAHTKLDVARTSAVEVIEDMGAKPKQTLWIKQLQNLHMWATVKSRLATAFAGSTGSEMPTLSMLLNEPKIDGGALFSLVRDAVAISSTDQMPVEKYVNVQLWAGALGYMQNYVLSSVLGGIVVSQKTTNKACKLFDSATAAGEELLRFSEALKSKRADILTGLARKIAQLVTHAVGGITSCKADASAKALIQTAADDQVGKNPSTMLVHKISRVAGAYCKKRAGAPDFFRKFIYDTCAGTFHGPDPQGFNYCHFGKDELAQSLHYGKDCTVLISLLQKLPLEKYLEMSRTELESLVYNTFNGIKEIPKYHQPQVGTTATINFPPRFRYRIELPTVAMLVKLRAQKKKSVPRGRNRRQLFEDSDFAEETFGELSKLRRSALNAHLRDVFQRQLSTVLTRDIEQAIEIFNVMVHIGVLTFERKFSGHEALLQSLTRASKVLSALLNRSPKLFNPGLSDTSSSAIMFVTSVNRAYLEPVTKMAQMIEEFANDSTPLPTVMPPELSTWTFMVNATIRNARLFAEMILGCNAEKSSTEQKGSSKTKGTQSSDSTAQSTAHQEAEEEDEFARQREL